MKWNRIVAGAFLVTLSAAGGYQVRAHAQQFPKPCTVIVPAAWGEYAGTSAGTGMVFEDQNGTLRIISQMPCSIDGSVSGPPAVLAEIRRK
jgi:hypothetical protein